ncbi:TPA: restriction endonuclease subunit S [Vibrio parahaemolyticus]|nr:restriction endonuclease subunit S [Vibrio parahaemolyticus]
MAVENLITEHIDIWTSAVKTKSTSGRGSSKKLELYGVKKLRDLILELAVRGKLVPQDPNDEPASDLLVESLKEKDALIKKGIVKKSRSKKTIKEEHFYDYPASWVVSRLEDLINVVNGRAYKKAEMLSEGTPILRVGNLFTSNDWYYSDLQLEADKYIDNGDLIYAWSASFGPFIWDGGKVIYHYHIWKMDIFRETSLDKEFSKLFLQAISERIKASGNGIAMIHMTKERMEKVMHPLPPINEQKQIVNRVNKLMTLCDQLEQQAEDSIEAHQVLVTTLLDTLTNSADADELMQNWARISEHFDTLFTTEESIDQLKQTILQLAVMGKLVPQDPNDEPVNKLLERIKNHQLDRVQRKEIQKPKKASVSTKLKMDIPKCWKSLLLNDLVFVTKLAGFEYTKYINLEDAGDVAVIRAQNVRPFKPDLENLKFIDNETSLSLPRSAIDRPSLLVTFIGAGIGDVCVFNEEKRWHLAPNVAKIEPYADLNLEYLCIYLNSPVGRGELFKSMKSTAQPSLSMTTIREIWVALPPVDEQKRIVTEVNKLFTLCDQLAVRLKASQVVQLHLTDVIAEQAV